MRHLITLVLAVAATVAAMIAPASVSASTTVTAWVSTYDAWNNSPPGCGIEYARDYGYNTVHNCAGGTGTYANPITFASQKSQWAPGTRIYIPYFRDYFVKEDWCATCYQLPRRQMDLWVGGVSSAQESNTSPDNIVNLWRTVRIEVNPPRGLPVNTTPLRQRRI